jgi:hypothetical protein
VTVAVLECVHPELHGIAVRREEQAGLVLDQFQLVIPVEIAVLLSDGPLALTPVEPEPSMLTVFPRTNSAEEPKTEAPLVGMWAEVYFPSLLSLNRLSRLVLLRCCWRSARIRASASTVRPDRSARSRRSTKSVMARS